MELFKEKNINTSEKIGIITYDIPHKKTYDTICLLKARGYENIIIYAVDFHYKKSFKPLYEHRPILLEQIKNLEKFCKNMKVEYKKLNSLKEIDLKEKGKILVCGAGIIPKEVIEKYYLINAHPGYIPEVRGLDALKWAIIEEKKIGVTTHLLGDEVDAGYIIERKIISLYKNDTFHSLAQRVYDTEICMLVDSLEKKLEKLKYVPAEKNELHRRMPKDIEINLLEKFEELKNKIGE